MPKTCTSCHEEKDTVEFFRNKNTSDGFAYSCKVCAKVYSSVSENKDRANQLRRESYSEDPQRYNEQSMKNYNAHRDERLESQKLYYENNKQYFSQKSKEYRETNKDAILLRNRQRKQSLSNFPIIKQSEITNLLTIHYSKCFYCEVEVKRGVNLHLDHKVPLSRGGKHILDNIVPSCKTCNLKKGTKTAEEFMSIGKNHVH